MIELPNNHTDLRAFFNYEVMTPARENAYGTEELTKEDKYNQSENFARVVRDSAYGVIDSMSGREHREYGLVEPISDELARQLMDLVKQEFSWLQNS
jgi:hypothetical protein